MLHSAIGQPLLELIPRVLDALTRGLDVVDRDADVPEPAVRLLVAMVDGVALVRLGAVVVRQLDNALAVEGAVAVRRRRRPVVRQEVEVELRLGERQLLDQAEAQELVELDCRGFAIVSSFPPPSHEDCRRSQSGSISYAVQCIPDSLGSLTRSLDSARCELASRLDWALIVAGGSSRWRLLHRVVELIVLRIGCCRHGCEGSANVYIYVCIY